VLVLAQCVEQWEVRQQVYKAIVTHARTLSLHAQGYWN